MSIAAAVVAVLVGPLTWWQVSARANVLISGDEFYSGTAATILEAGTTTEYCYPDKPGWTFTFGFSIRNTGGHDVTVRSISTISYIAHQKITVNPHTDGSSSDPTSSTQTLPLTIHPGQERELYVAMHLSTDIVDTDGGESYFDSVTLKVRSLGISRTEDLPLGEGHNPVWVGISGLDAHGKSCDRTQPPDV